MIISGAIQVTQPARSVLVHGRHPRILALVLYAKPQPIQPSVETKKKPSIGEAVCSARRLARAHQQCDATSDGHQRR